MATCVLEMSLDAADGIRTVFRTPSDYAPGSVRVLRNGQWQTELIDDGWIELGGNKVQLKDPPKPGDDIMFFYIRF